MAEMAEMILATYAYERGSSIRVTLDRVEAAQRAYTKRHPEGFHAHYELDPRGGYVEFSVTDARHCTFRGGHVGPTTEIGASDFMAHGYYDGGAGRVTPESMSRSQLHSVLMSQHVALLVLMEKHGVVSFSVTPEDYNMAQGSTMGIGALSISKNREGVHVSRTTVVNDVEV